MHVATFVIIIIIIIVVFVVGSQLNHIRGWRGRMHRRVRIVFLLINMLAKDFSDLRNDGNAATLAFGAGKSPFRTCADNTQTSQHRQTPANTRNEHECLNAHNGKTNENKHNQ
jgi:hypothetical protein